MEALLFAIFIELLIIIVLAFTAFQNIITYLEEIRNNTNNEG